VPGSTDSASTTTQPSMSAVAVTTTAATNSAPSTPIETVPEDAGAVAVPDASAQFSTTESGVLPPLSGSELSATASVSATSSARLMCNAPLADCDANHADCETNLTSSQSCGENCADVAVCDAASAGKCVNAGCGHEWAAWPIPNSGEVQGLPNPEMYLVGADGSVADKVTDLVWQRETPTTTFKHADAITYCQGLKLAGHADWRLPTYIELLTLVNLGRSEPAIDVNAFPGTQNGYWTASSYAGSLDSAWLVYFSDGTSSGLGVADTHHVRCVR
jgi:hypothetical protein